MELSIGKHDLVIFEGDKKATSIEMGVYNPVFGGKIIIILTN